VKVCFGLPKQSKINWTYSGEGEVILIAAKLYWRRISHNCLNWSWSWYWDSFGALVLGTARNPVIRRRKLA